MSSLRTRPRPLRSSVVAVTVLVLAAFPQAAESLAGPLGGVGPGSFEVVAAGDIACDPRNPAFNHGRGTASTCRQRDTARLIRAIDPDLVLALGDTQYDDGKLWKYRKSYGRSWGRFRGITRPAIGNHEYWSGRLKGYFRYFGAKAGRARRGWYSLDRGGWHLVALNSNCRFEVDCTRGSNQHRWLSRDLSSNAAQCELAFFHHPLFSSGPHGNDRRVRPLWRLLHRAGVEIVLVGHDHIYERFAPLSPDGKRDVAGGIRQFTVGTGGAQHYSIRNRQPHSLARNTDAFGVLRLRLGTGAYSWKFASVRGDRFRDSGTGACH